MSNQPLLSEQECLYECLRNPEEYLLCKSIKLFQEFCTGVTIGTDLLALSNVQMLCSKERTYRFNRNDVENVLGPIDWSRLHDGLTVVEHCRYLSRNETDAFALLEAALSPDVEKVGAVDKKDLINSIPKGVEIKCSEWILTAEKLSGFYLAEPTFPSLAACINGIYARCRCDFESLAVTPNMEMFGTWLSHKHEYLSQRQRWDVQIYYLSGFRDVTGMECFFRLFNEWLQSTSARGPLEFRDA